MNGEVSKVRELFGRTGLPLAHAVALLGAHPFGLTWRDPGAAERSEASTSGRRVGGVPARPSAARLTGLQQLRLSRERRRRLTNRFFVDLAGGSPGVAFAAFLLQDEEIGALVRTYAKDEALFLQAFRFVGISSFCCRIPVPPSS